MSLAAGLLRLRSVPEQADRLPMFRTVDWAAAFAWLEGVTGGRLAAEQETAVRLALTERVAVLTGGPGCGKSFTVRAVVALAQAKKARVLLAAPTGRAAKRLSELAGMDAQTLHRLLELRPGGEAAFNQDRPLEADLVVVDEASMLDLLLANKLVRAVPPGAHLLLVGDVDQLPSVGPGEVLRDLLQAGGRHAPVLPRVRLTQVFRQAQHSGVVTNAHRINAGHPPLTSGLGDFFLFAEDDPERVAELTVDIVVNRLPRRFGLDPRRDVQVLCPMHRGPAGSAALNERLQEVLTPAVPRQPERRFAGRTYRPGDKVMQVRNDYEKGVFNGSVGTVTTISPETSELFVLMDEDQEVRYGFDDLDELTHAYALTVHRAQGSEYPCVVVPADPDGLAHAAAQPALHGRQPCPAAGRAGGLAARPGQGHPDRRRRPPLHRPGRPPPARRHPPGRGRPATRPRAAAPWAGLAPREHLVADGDGDVGVVAEHPVEPELVEQPQLGREVAGRLEIDRAGRVALAEVLGQERVLAAERPRVDQQPGPVGVPDQGGRRQQPVLGVAGHDQVLVDPDPVGVAWRSRPAPPG